MRLIDIIAEKRAHIARLANQGGAAGEIAALGEMKNWVQRPKGVGLKVLLTALRDSGIAIKGSSFDAIAFADSLSVDFTDVQQVAATLPAMSFVEIRSANQSRGKPGFEGFFFALTEAEILAAEALGSRHKVALFNKQTGDLRITSVPEILALAKSSNWQLSVQL